MLLRPAAHEMNVAWGAARLNGPRLAPGGPAARRRV